MRFGLKREVKNAYREQGYSRSFGHIDRVKSTKSEVKLVCDLVETRQSTRCRIFTAVGMISHILMIISLAIFLAMFAVVLFPYFNGTFSYVKEMPIFSVLIETEIILFFIEAVTIILYNMFAKDENKRLVAEAITQLQEEEKLAKRFSCVDRVWEKN